MIRRRIVAAVRGREPDTCRPTPRSPVAAGTENDYVREAPRQAVLECSNATPGWPMLGAAIGLLIAIGCGGGSGGSPTSPSAQSGVRPVVLRVTDAISGAPFQGINVLVGNGGRAVGATAPDGTITLEIVDGDRLTFGGDQIVERKVVYRGAQDIAVVPATHRGAVGLLYGPGPQSGRLVRPTKPMYFDLDANLRPYASSFQRAADISHRGHEWTGQVVCRRSARWRRDPC